MEQTFTSTVRIKVFVDGSIVADDQPVSLLQLDQRLSDLAKSQGLVLYHREAADTKAHPNASEVVKLIIKHRLPVSLSSNPDFSDWIDDRGVPRPRE